MPTALGAVQGAYASGASSINDAGQVVGNVYLNDAYTEEVAVIWNNGATSRNVVSAEEWKRKTKRVGNLAEFFASSPLRGSGLRVKRSKDGPRKVDL